MDTPAHEAIATFKELRGNYAKFCEVLQTILEDLAKRLHLHVIVQARAKDIPGFAEKISRKGYTDPFRQMTDLCGVRVIAETSAQVQAVCAGIRELFDVDEPNSEDKLEKLKAGEFGYRSVHFVVSLRRGMHTAVPELDIPDFLYESLDDSAGPVTPRYKAEIQVRTIMQHAWASVVHDNLYKSQFNSLKHKWKRDASRIAALIEDADESFSTLLTDIEAYKHHYGAYLSPEEIEKEIKTLNAVSIHAPENRNLIARIARLQLALGETEKAIAVLGDPDKLGQQGRNVLAEALLRRKGGSDLEEARRLLSPSAPDGKPTDAVAEGLLADSYPEFSPDALEHAQKAFHLNPSEPANLLRYLLNTLIEQRSCRILPLLAPAMEKAVKLAQERVEIKVGLPATLLDICLLELLRGKTYAALEALLQAVASEKDLPWLEAFLVKLRAVQTATGKELPGVDWILASLELIKTARAMDGACPAACANPPLLPCPGGLAKPVVIVAGGCDEKVASRIEAYKDILARGFQDFKGTVICGGTKAGISGAVGDLPGAPERFKLISHLPSTLPREASLHKKYEVRDAGGQGFTPLGPIQGWLDILASGIAPGEVRVVGVNGGPLAGFEYMLAATLGARVGLMRDSGREAVRLLDDPFWSTLANVLPLPSDGLTLYEFLRPEEPGKLLSKDAQQKLGKLIHAEYLDSQKGKAIAKEPNLREWEQLDEGLKRSNIAVATHYEAKLAFVGLAIRENKGEIALFEFSPEQVAHMAELEHARWNLERLQEGWRLDVKKDVDNKRSPHLVGWQELSAEIKQYDVDIVNKIPLRLQELGYEIYDPTA